MLPSHSHHHQVVLKSKNDYKIPTLLSFPSPPISPRRCAALPVISTEKPVASGYMGKKEVRSKSYVEQFRIQAMIRQQGKAKKCPVKNVSCTPKIWNQNPAARFPRRTVEVSEPVKLKTRISKTIKGKTMVETRQSKGRTQGEIIVVQSDAIRTPVPALIKSKCDLSTTVPQVQTGPSQSKDCNNNDNDTTIELPKRENLLSNNSTVVTAVPHNETVSRNFVNEVTCESTNVVEHCPEQQPSCCRLCATQTNKIRSTTSLQRNNLTMEVTLVIDSSLSKPNDAGNAGIDISPVQKSYTPTIRPQLENVAMISSHLQKSDVKLAYSPEEKQNTEKDRSEIKTPEDHVQQMQIRVAKSFVVSTNQELEVTAGQNTLAQPNPDEPVRKQSIPSLPPAEGPELNRNPQDASTENTEIQKFAMKEEKEQEKIVDSVIDSTRRQSSIQVLSEPHDFGPCISKDAVTPYLANRKIVPVKGKSEKVSKQPKKSGCNSKTPEKGCPSNATKQGCEVCRPGQGLVGNPQSVTERGKVNSKTPVKSHSRIKPIPTPPATPPRRRLIFRKSPPVEKPDRMIGPLNKVPEEIDKMAPAFCRSSVFEIPSRENVQWQKSQEGYLSFSSIVLLYKVDQRMAGLLRLTNQSSQGVFFRVSSSCDFPDRYTLEPKEGKVEPYKRVLIKITTETVLEEIEFREDIFKIETVTYNETITYTSCRRFWMNVDHSKIVSAFTSCMLLYHPKDAFFRACLLHSKSKLKELVDLQRGTGLTVTLKEILEDIEVTQKELDTIRRMELVNLAISICIALLGFAAAWYHLT